MVLRCKADAEVVEQCLLATQAAQAASCAMRLLAWRAGAWPQYPAPKIATADLQDAQLLREARAPRLSDGAFPRRTSVPCIPSLEDNPAFASRCAWQCGLGTRTVDDLDEGHASSLASNRAATA